MFATNSALRDLHKMPVKTQDWRKLSKDEQNREKPCEPYRRS